MLLNRFSYERKPGKFQTNAFDKTNGRTIRTAVENVAVEGDFNAVTLGAETVSWEGLTSTIENLAAPHIAQINATSSIAALTSEARADLCIFVALQFLRGTDTRAMFADMAERLRDRLLLEGVVPGSQAAELLELPDADDLKVHSLHTIERNLVEFAEHFADKDLLLIKAPEGCEFLIGDAPVVMHNTRDFGPMGNLGLAVPGIEIHLPLSPTLTLAFYCPTNLSDIAQSTLEANAERHRLEGIAILGRPDLAAKARERLTHLEPALAYNESLLSAHRHGGPLLCAPDSVLHCNSLQIANAERWIVSRSGDFSLARRMLAENPKLRSGRRASFA